MKKRIFSVLVSIILIFSIICCATVPGSAIFVVDDAVIASLIMSVCASVVLSYGIAAATGNTSVYEAAATAIAEACWDSLSRQYTIAEILAMTVIVNGKLYLREDSSLLDMIKNFVNNYDFSDLKYNQSLNLTNTNFPWLSSNYGTSKNSYALAVQPSPLTINFGATTINYIPSRGINWHLSNCDIFWKGNTTTFGLPMFTEQLNGFVGGLSIPQGDSGTVFLSYVVHNGNPTSSPSDSDYFTDGGVYGGGYFPLITGNRGTNIYYTVINGQVHNVYSNNGTIYIDNNNTPLTHSVDFNSYVKKCILAGTLLVSKNNPYLSVNTSSSLDSIEKPVETQVYNPSIPGNRLGENEVALIPIPGNFVDPSSGVPLTQGTVKNRVKRGQDVAFVPDITKLDGKTPEDLGVQIVNNVDIEDTVISPTLSTTYIGENSTTYAIIPQYPAVTPIPDNLDNPVYSSPYPDVINPGNDQITVTANNDVFPTAGVTPSERPSVQVTDNAEIASSAVEGISEIASEAVSDIVQPVGPGDVERNANRMKISSQLLHKFPFCIPYDFYNAVAQFAAPGEVIKFDIPFDIDRLNIHYTFHIDLTQFETVAKISRWFFSVSWVVVLILITRKVIWK